MKDLFLQMKKKLKEKKGVTVLIASLVASILLAVGLSIFNTTLKDLVFASTGDQSAVAFYAADTAAECALYWDYKGLFATSSASIATPINGANDCDTQDITRQAGSNADNWSVANVSSNHAETTFYLNSTTANGVTGMCAVVTVTKDAPLGTVATTISSYGYNTCVVSNLRRVERGVQLSY